MLRSPWLLWGTVLGLALGGLFEGVLLRQILQWHHLLSLIPGAGDLRAQLRWDGWFQAAMYVLAVIALAGLWGAHRRTYDHDGRGLAGGLVAGFGLWHVLDGIFAHWVLDLHRIRPDSGNPLMWDLIWFFVFGIGPLVLAGLLLRDGSLRGRSGSLTSFL